MGCARSSSHTAPGTAFTISTPRRPRLRLDELLAATPVDTELMLDLKGPRKRLAEGVLCAIKPYLSERRFTVCARWWRLLEPFAGTPVRCVYSIGNERQLRSAVRRFANQAVEGVSIHERLADRETVGALGEIADVVLAWRRTRRRGHVRFFDLVSSG